MENRNIWIPRNVLWGFFFFFPVWFLSSRKGLEKLGFYRFCGCLVFSLSSPRDVPLPLWLIGAPRKKRREWAWLPRWSENAAPGARSFRENFVTDVLFVTAFIGGHIHFLSEINTRVKLFPFQGCCSKRLTVLKRTRQCKVFLFFLFLSLKNVLEEFQMEKKKTYTLQRKRIYLSHMTSSGTAPQRLAHMHRELWLKRAGQVRRTRWPIRRHLGSRCHWSELTCCACGRG